MKIHLVGGAVRDALLGLAVHERDWVVTQATPEDMIAAGYLPVGKDFPVFLHPKTKDEHALARTERKSGRGYHGFTFHTGPEVTLEDDLLRRDLTINAIAQDGDGRLFDPHGGQRDLADKVLRHVSPSFAEDPVRVLRLARFAARFAPLGFTVAPETMALCRQLVEAGEVDALVPERCWQEMARALMHDTPSVFFKVLHACGALARIVPELAALDGVPQRADYHPEVDSFVHTLMCVDVGAREGFGLEVRTAALLHDLGKAATPMMEWPSHKGHDARGVPLVERVCARLKIPTACREIAVHHTREHLLVHIVRELRPATLLELLERLDAFRKPDRLARVCEASLCDARGRLHFEQCAYPQVDYLHAAYQTASAVPVQQVIADGFAGAAVSAELKQRRVAALTDFKTAQKRASTPSATRVC
ncbi:MAG: multifunctional CCA addition/repair protein [Stagnimonas sp.]|nr:multifunctional CCA addition/repair protein [Stagnimonas sp.]